MALTTKTTTDIRIRLAAVLTALGLLLGIAPIAVLADEREALINDSITISSGAFFRVIATMTGEDGESQQATIYHNKTTDEYEIDDPMPMGGQFQAWFQMNGSGGRNRSNLYVKIVQNNTGSVVTTADQNGTVGEYWINETGQPDLHINGDGTAGKSYTLDPSAWLNPGTDYYLLISKSSACGNTTFGKDFVIHFRTDGESGSPEEANVESVSLSETGLLFEGLGRSYGLAASVMPKNAADKAVSWASADPSVATVDDNGLVTAVSPGTTTVTATTHDGAKTATCLVTVRTAETPRTLVKVPEGAILQTGNQNNYRVDAPEVYRDTATPGRLVVLTPFDLTTDPVFITASYNVGGGVKTMSQHVNVYSDAGLTNAVAQGGIGNESAPVYPQVGMTSTSNEGKSDLIGTYTVQTSVLSPGNTYYFVLEADTSVGNGGMWGEQVIVEFTTSGEHEDPLPMPLAVTSFESSMSTALKEKTETTLTAAATGGKAPYTYKFIVYNPQTNQWYKIRDFESSDSCTWYTGAAGTKTLYVDVKDSEGTVARKKLDVTVSADTTEPLTVTAFQSSKGTALTEKTETTLRATATGGKSPYTYKFIVYNTKTNQWFRIRDFESASTCTWYTGAAGTKVLYVDVKDSAGNVVRKELNVTVSENTSPLAASYFTSSKGSTLNSGDTTTLMAKATGGSGSGYRYKFIVYNPQTNQWYKIQDYSASSSASWYTGAAGAKTLYVDITDSAGNYVRTPLNVTVK